MLIYYKEIIKNTIRACQLYKKHQLFTINDVNICVRALELLYDQCNELDDLNSRSKNFLLQNIEKPDDALIFALLLKNLSDRQISL